MAGYWSVGYVVGFQGGKDSSISVILGEQIRPRLLHRRIAEMLTLLGAENLSKVTWPIGQRIRSEIRRLQRLLLVAHDVFLFCGHFRSSVGHGGI